MYIEGTNEICKKVLTRMLGSLITQNTYVKGCVNSHIPLFLSYKNLFDLITTSLDPQSWIYVFGMYINRFPKSAVSNNVRSRIKLPIYTKQDSGTLLSAWQMACKTKYVRRQVIGLGTISFFFPSLFPLFDLTFLFFCSFHQKIQMAR